MAMERTFSIIKPDAVDSVWEIIARATALGQLGCSAKISPGTNRGRDACCCVYVKDFNDKQEVKRVLLKIKSLLESECRAPCVGFKADIHTILGINGNNKWGLLATLYKVADVLTWEFE